MEVLGLFDGHSCGQIALRDPDNKRIKYYASEIDKFAIAQTQLNFPETIQLGDIENWRNWNIDWSKINLILAGSPCQGFSFAGKQLNFNDPRSKLFFVFVDILNHCKKFNPDVKFLLENVNMKKEYQLVINNILGLFPVRINSNLVSAQNRDRLYWTNIKIKMVSLFNEIHTDIEQPKDREILLKDILQPESEVNEKYYLSDKMINGFVNKKTKGFENRFKPHDNTNVKANCINSSTSKMVITDNYIKLDKQLNEKADQYKAGCLTGGGNSGGNHSDMDIICVSSNQKNATISKNKSTPMVSAMGMGGGHVPIITGNIKLRRLTPLECARLQTIPSWYKWECSDTQQYKMLGNGWTIDIVKHILSFLRPTP